METPTNPIRINYNSCFLTLLISFLSLPGFLTGQDIGYSFSIPGEASSLTIGDILSNPLGDAYPECPELIGTLRFVYSNHEVIRFMEKPIAGKFYYVVQLVYMHGQHDLVSREVKEGNQFEIDYSRFDVPDEVRVKRVCHLLEAPFIYHSDWAIAPIVHSSRSVADSICNNFNGAEVLFNPTDSSYTFYSSYEDRSWSSYAVRFEIILTYCNEEDTIIYITNFPTVITQDGTICAIEMTMQYQNLTTEWYDCETFTVFENSIHDLQDIYCDGNHPNIDTQNTTLITSLFGEESFNLAGFEIEIISLSDSLSGTGILTLPFQNKKLLVNFDDLGINDDLIVVSIGNGSISAAVNGSVNMPTGSLSLGGEVCVLPQSPEWNEDGTHSLTGELWDPNGFGQNGQYILEPPYPGYQDGDPYDPNYDPCGFNVNGIHVVTDSLCNSDGCSRDSITCETIPQPCELDCVPYSWLQDDEATQAGIIFYDSISANLPDDVDSLLNIIQTEYEESLIQNQEDCHSLAASMRSIVSTENLDSTSIFGETSQYINPGLSTKFISVPQKSVVRSLRDTNIVNLEDNHVDLFYCDQRSLALEVIIAYIDSLVENKSELMEYLEQKIKAFKSDSVQIYNNPQTWLNKLKSLITKFIETGSKDQNGIGSLNLKKFDVWDENTNLKRNGIQPSPSINPYTLLGLFGSSQIKKVIHQRISRSLIGEGEDVNALPLEISLTIGGDEVKIIITEIGFTPEHLTVSAYFIYNLPNDGEQIIFQCQDLKFSPNGFIDEAKLILGSDTRIKLFNVAHLNLDADSTYVEWNCNGFAKMNISGYIEFCNNVLIPIDPETQEPSTDPDQYVKAYFQTSITKLDGFYVSLDVDSFAVAGATNVRFAIENAALDMSTITSPAGLFPVGYTHEHARVNPDGIPYPSPMWKGFYLGHLNVSIIGGDLFAEDDLIVDMYNAVIDDRGFSGIVEIGANLVSLEDGNIGGWAFSVDTFNLHFLFNHLVGAGFQGLLNVPIFKSECEGGNTTEIEEDDCFNYVVQFVNGNEFQFSVSPKTQMCVSVWSAHVVLDSNSTIVLRKTNDDFFLETNLCGTAYFGDSTATVNDTSIWFQNVQLRNKAPFFSPGEWYVPRFSVEIGAFEMSVSHIRLDSVPNEINKTRLSFVAGVEINSDFSLKAEGGFSIIGDLVTTNNRQRWVYVETKVHGLYIEADIKGTHIAGGLRYFDEQEAPEFGSGFKACLDVSFAKLNFGVRASGIFGKVNEFNYFNVDVLAEFNPGIPILGPLEVNALGGGLSYHMSETGGLESLPTNMDVQNDSTSIFQMPLGQSLTGVIYEPDIDADIGLKIILAGVIRDSAICSYNAVFSILFGTNGLDEVSLKGNVRLMAELVISDIPTFPESLEILTSSVLGALQPPSIEAEIKGYFSITFKANPASLDGRFGLFLRAGSQQNPIIYGEAIAELHIDDDEWYFNLGRIKNNPDGRANISLDVAILKLKVQSYLNIGTGIPPMPDPPEQIKRLFGNVSSSDASLGWGTGFAFGVAVDLNLDIDLLIGSIKLNAGFGYDLSIKQYQDVVCHNTESEVGINGWYATGQAYIYVIGDVRLFGAKLLNISAGALLQAGFPNPTWVRGQLAIKYKILIIEGSLKARVNFGEQCIPVAEEGSELPPVIANVIPMNGSYNVDVLSSIHVDFNLPMETEITYGDEENSVTYRTEIDSVILKSEMGFPIPILHDLNEEKTHLELIPAYTLPSNDSLTFTIKVKVFKNNEELDSLNGLERTVGFKTNKGLFGIPAANLGVSYPIDGMTNFYRDEYQLNKGYVLLKRNQYELFNLPQGKQLAMVLSSPQGRNIGPAKYVFSTKSIEYALPVNNLESGEFYQVEVGITNLNLVTQGDNLIPISEVNYLNFSPVWSAIFRVSQYESLFDKISDMTQEMELNSEVDLENFYSFCASLPIAIEEPFDEVEILPNANQALASLTSDKFQLVDISLDMDMMSTHSDFNEEWEWFHDQLKKFSDPIQHYLANRYQIKDFDRYTDIKKTVYVGGECNAPVVLHPSIPTGAYACMAGTQTVANFLDPSDLDNLENSNGNSINPYDSSIASSQYIVLKTPMHMFNSQHVSKIKAQLYINQEVSRCMNNLEVGRSHSRTNEDQPCSPALLVNEDLITLAYTDWPFQVPPFEIKLPIKVTYTLPGINLTSSIHNFIFTITIP